MSEFLVAVLRIAYLAVLWIFILVIGNTIRSDIFGHRVARAAAPGGAPAPSRRSGRGRPEEPRTLRVISGSRAGLVVPLEGRIIVGRGGDATIVIDDDYASTHHAELTQGVDGAWFVEDLASTNGTYVNGTAIEEPTRLGVGDEVRIGRTVMVMTGRE
ncbi:FHA domain-containing protein FhaB/FipA [Acidipropionibacterium timonense]|uniref:FHA domain-containing protein FhaB/FipA n=1 Tax=Acidipropionibacterium timonense TaxID=2161818 RepID=UPI00102F6288|nr:FHA domain-containing protein [Acidipropionibacterium timonense]